MTNRLKEWREIAGDATPGPWYESYDGLSIACAEDRSKPFQAFSNYRQGVIECNIEFIATFNPSTIAKLLDVVDAASKVSNEFWLMAVETSEQGEAVESLVKALAALEGE